MSSNDQAIFWEVFVDGLINDYSMFEAFKEDKNAIPFKKYGLNSPKEFCVAAQRGFTVFSANIPDNCKSLLSESSLKWIAHGKCEDFLPLVWEDKDEESKDDNVELKKDDTEKPTEKKARFE
tara:strand:- start:1045 stop:1410 length:366 start_codon:yes stop_codon:yes gene_type:complete